ncbi:MAG: hypothetical protein ACI38A_04100 [Candidatus Ornithomonoglobus sp.]
MIEIKCPKCSKVFRCEKPQSDAMVHCPYCGIKLKLNRVIFQSAPPDKTAEPVPLTKKQEKTIIIGIIASLVLIFAVIVLAVCLSGKHSNDATDQTAVETTVSPMSETQTASQKPTKTEAPTTGPEEASDNIISDRAKVDRSIYTPVTYEYLARNPEDHKLENVKLSGTVVQVIDDPEIYTSGAGMLELRVAVDGDYDSIVYVNYIMGKNESRILDGDEVTVYGLSLGLYTYNSLAGAVTLPQIEAQLIE